MCLAHAAIHAEKFRALFDESDAAGGTGAAQEREALPHRPAAAGDHLTPFRIGIDVNDCHLVPVDLQLIGDDAGERGTDMLAHFRPDDVDGYSAVAADRIPDGRFKQIAGSRRPARVQGKLGSGERRAGISQYDASFDGCDQKVAPRERVTFLTGRAWGAGEAKHATLLVCAIRQA